MIAACPSCQTRYRVDPLVVPDGARLRCARCQTVFRVRAAKRETPAPTGAGGASRLEDRGERRPGVDRERLVIVGVTDVDAARRTRNGLSSRGLQPMLVHDGVEAMLAIQRMLPRAVILDAALPAMTGSQVCEIIKRNGSLREIAVALVDSRQPAAEHRGPPSELYGPDFQLELSALPGDLYLFLRRAGLELVDAPERPASLPVREAAAPAVTESPPAPLQPPSVEPPAPMPEPPAPIPAQPVFRDEPVPRDEPVSQGQPETRAEDPLSAERARAERLARIIVSDIALYNPEKFKAAAASGDPVTALEDELDEGRALFQSRIDPRVRGEKDHLVLELQRAAREAKAP